MICVTNETNSFPSCTILGQHTWHCSDNSCEGCMPAQALHGYLCEHCWDRVIDALARVGEYLDAIAGVEHLVRRDNLGVAANSVHPPIPLTPSILIEDELRGLLRSYPGTPEQWANTLDGAEDALRFARAFESARANHPIEDRPHQIVRVRCPECLRQSLLWLPPAGVSEDVRVYCRNVECGRLLTQDEYEAQVMVQSA